MNPWRAEFSLILLALLVGLFLGKIFNHPMVVLVVMILTYLSYHLASANHLLKWLRSGKTSQLPNGTGIWEEIYYLNLRLRRRNRRRKKQLIRLLERFRTATAALPDATVILGAEEEIDWYNDAAARLLGLRRSDIGQQIGNLLRFPPFVEYLKAAEYTKTVGIVSPVNDAIQLEIRVIPYGDDLRLLIAQDVTQLRFMERVRTDFVANVSHELRTPLTVIRGYVESLVDQSEGLPPQNARALKRIEEQTLRMQSLIDDLLTLTRLEASSHPQTRQTVDVPSLLKQLFEEASDLPIESKPALELALDSDRGLLGSETELRSAFSNLIQNALKYCSEGDRVSLRWFEDADGGHFEVTDTGEGIAPEFLPRLTERFYRVDPGREAGGTGLGLAIVKHVLARHGAELKIQSTIGKGSRFTCHFHSDRLVAPNRKSGVNATM